MGDPSRRLELVGNEYNSDTENDTRTAIACTPQRVGKWAWEHAIRDSDLVPHARLLCLTLSTYMDVDGSNAFPSVDTIATSMGLSKAAAHRAKATAASSGYLIEEKGGGRGRSTRYFAAVPKGVSSETVSEERVSLTKERVSLAVLNSVSSETRPDQTRPPDQTMSSDEDEQLKTFLDLIAPKLNAKTANKLADERRDPANAPKLGLITALLASRQGSPSKAAKDVLASTDLNNATKSVLGLTLSVLKEL